ncbi:MAG: type 4a pilus biogenesis protein PilO [bacterium]|nr:type 4a pilus biogenesis protein PilO [bacterium]
MNFRPNRRLTDALGAGAVVALGGATYVLGIHPVREHQAQAAVARTVIAERESQLAAVLDDTAKVRAVIDAVKADLNASFPLRELSHQNERLGELSAEAEKTGLILDELRPGAAVWDRRFGAVPIRISGSGGFEPFVAFLGGIAKSFPDVRVVSFTLNAQPGNSANVPTFATELIWFTKPQQAAPVVRAVPAGTAAPSPTPR